MKVVKSTEKLLAVLCDALQVLLQPTESCLQPLVSRLTYFSRGERRDCSTTANFATSVSMQLAQSIEDGSWKGCCTASLRSPARHHSTTSAVKTCVVLVLDMLGSHDVVNVEVCEAQQLLDSSLRRHQLDICC